jgi:8-oxo-dGTP pyrophosphatase MutT (NUDIX family)
VGSDGSSQPGKDLPLKPEARSGLRAALAGRPRDAFDLEGFRRAGVLVPLFLRDGELSSVVTLRRADLRAHAGQWAFAGGRVDDEEDVVGAAVREAEEEIGIDPASVEPLGLLGDVPTPSLYTITPVVAWLDPPPAAYRPNPAEVAEVLELALARLRAPGVLEVGGEIERWGTKFQMLRYRVDGKEIWGATARILAELLSVIA